MNRKYVIDDTKYMTMTQCLRIRDNQYRNADCTEDYCPFAIEERIADLGTKQAERMVDNRRDGGFDEQLFAMLPVGQQLLNLIDCYFINYNVHRQTQTNKGVNMKFQHVTFKAANMRKVEQFTVYPHTQNDDHWKVQSNHRIAKIYKNGDMVISKYVANYPSFVYLSDVLLPFKLKASDEIMTQLNSLQSTGKVVCVVGA